MTGEKRATTVLELRGVWAGYGRATVLRDVDLTVPAGSVVALIGANGAGKTTLLRCAAGALRATQGTVLVHGKDVTNAPPHRRSRAGVCLIPEGRGVYRNLTVADNLRMHVPRWVADRGIADAIEVFPLLGERLDQTAGSMSGGQQQMLAIARAFLSRPDIVMLDEVSMGLAPKVVAEIFEALRRLPSAGVSVVLVEQYVQRAIELADHVVLLGRGRVAFAGPTAALDQDEVMREYLGADIGAHSRTPPVDDSSHTAKARSS